jgi:hypothetical protein
VALRVESASEQEKLVWVYRLASIVEKDAPRHESESFLKEIEAWQTKKGVPKDDFESVLAELAAED